MGDGFCKVVLMVELLLNLALVRNLFPVLLSALRHVQALFLRVTSVDNQQHPYSTERVVVIEGGISTTSPFNSSTWRP